MDTRLFSWRAVATASGLALLACSPGSPAERSASTAHVPADARPYADLSELKRQLEHGPEPSDANWRSALLGNVIRHRPLWSADHEFGVWVKSPDELGHVEARFDPREAGLASVSAGEHVPTCGTMTLFGAFERAYQVVGTLAPGEHRLVFDVEVERRAPDDFDPYFDSFREPLFPDILWRGEIALDVSVVDSVDEVLEPVRGSELDDWVRRSLRFDLREEQRGLGELSSENPLVAELWFRPDEPPEALRTTAFSVEVVLREGRLALDRAVLVPGDRHTLAVPLERLQSGGPWTLAVEGTGRNVLENPAVERRYAGRVEMSLDDRLRDLGG